MKDEPPSRLHRTAEQDLDLVVDDFGVDVELLQKVGESEGLDLAVYHQAHCTVGGVGTNIDDRAREAGVVHLRHGDQQLPRKVARS